MKASTLGWALLIASFLPACRRSELQSAPAYEPAPSTEVIRRALADCIPAPAMVAEPGCSLQADAGPAPVACFELSPQGGTIEVSTLILARAPYDPGVALGLPSAVANLPLEAGEPMMKVWRDFEGPRFESLPDGRQLRIEARDAFLGGVVDWGTLASPRSVFTTTLVREIPLHDAPLADTDRAALLGWDMAKVLACLDRHFWPGH